VTRERTSTRSFRLTESALLALEEESKRRNISVNTLLNSLLLSFTEYDRFFSQFHMLKLSRSTLKDILQATSDESIMQAGRAAGGNIPRSFILAKHGELSEESALEYLRMMGQYANMFEYNLVPQSQGWTLTLIHELGDKGSLLFGEYSRALFDSVGSDTRVTLGKSSVTLDLVKKNAPEA
jgi:hypothetical protein